MGLLVRSFSDNNLTVHFFKIKLKYDFKDIIVFLFSLNTHTKLLTWGWKGRTTNVMGRFVNETIMYGIPCISQISRG